MLKTCKRTPFDLRCSRLPPTVANHRPPDFPRTTVIASSKRISTNSTGQKKAATAAAKALVSESIIPVSQAKVGANVLAITIFRPAVTRKPWWLKVEMFIERGVVAICRLFALIAVAGSLLGSLLCFVKGCLHILETYFLYFHVLSLGLGQGQTVKLLIEAIDMFVVGTVLLSIGVGLYVMFGGSNDRSADKGWLVPGFHLKGLPTWMQMQSVSQAKLKMGQAVLKTLQVDLLEKLADVTMTSGLDLACIAGTVAVSSATVFLISRLSAGGRILKAR